MSTAGQRPKFAAYIVRRDGHVAPLVVEIPATRIAMALGFGHRRLIRKGTGMLFRYKAHGVKHFSMRGMLVPLDFLALGPDGRVLQIIRDVAADFSGRLELHGTNVLEVPAGWTLDHAINEGDLFRLGAPPKT